MAIRCQSTLKQDYDTTKHTQQCIMLLCINLQDFEFHKGNSCYFVLQWFQNSMNTNRQNKKCWKTGENTFGTSVPDKSAGSFTFTPMLPNLNPDAPFSLKY